MSLQLLHLDVRRETGVATVTFDRPPANGMNRDFFVELEALVGTLAGPEVRAVVVTGTGRFFSAGLDLFEVFAYDPPAFTDFTARFDAGFTALFGLMKPVVAAVNGHAVAGGAVLAATADFRLMAAGPGRIGLTEILVGVPFPATIMEIVRFASGGPYLPELLYHGRLYAAEEAVVRRLADEVVPADELMPRAVALAETLAGRAPAAFVPIKRALRADALARMAAAVRDGDPIWDVWRSPETHAAVAAYRARTLAAKDRR